MNDYKISFDELAWRLVTDDQPPVDTLLPQTERSFCPQTGLILSGTGDENPMFEGEFMVN